MYLDEQCGYNFNEAIEKYKIYCNNKKSNKSNVGLIIVFSNNFEFIKGIRKMFPKPNVVINITENLSEYHVSNSLKYVSDICYLKSDVKTVVDRIMKTYSRICLKEMKIHEK